MRRAEPTTGHTGPYFLWPQFDAGGHPLLDLFLGDGIVDAVQPLIRDGLPFDRPTFAQVALTIPPHPHRPGHPHIDGLTPAEDDGRPGTFTLLAGLVLTGRSTAETSGSGPAPTCGPQPCCERGVRLQPPACSADD